MAATAKWLHVKEVRGESVDPKDAAKTIWEKKKLVLGAYKGYEAFTGELSLSDRGEWAAGEYKNLDDATFNEAVATMRRVTDSGIYPLFEDGLTQFDPSSMPEGSYFLKSPDATQWDGSDFVAKILLTEAWTNEVLLSKPHPHLGAYLGCVVHDGRIVRLAFPLYVETLYDRIQKLERHGVERMNADEREKCMRTIGEAVTHLHSLGYGHNDISAANIMFDQSDDALLIDVGSSTRLGEKIKKGGVAGGWRGPLFWGQEFNTSSAECDQACLKYIDEWLSGTQE
ncbi:hypothetical protein LLEC1_05955 [Akanthomyces lecanii]|uniref:EKC/KEOPS complex subunit BUD32 n=1 Tax=Cordyceps confragosa TaxID=2714763 RepID=A0A179IIF6_CORDF|nr:hypothetical protein LLEC1_05955 [Akanthomyces lecanii]